MDTQLIQIIIQGGAVGILLVFGYGAYKIANRVITVAQSLLGNHLNDLTEAIKDIGVKIDKLTNRRE